MQMTTVDRRKWNKLKRAAREVDCFTPQNSEQEAKRNRCHAVTTDRGAAFIKKHPEYFPETAR